MKISGLVITLNEEKNISDCLTSLFLICDDVVVIDSYSSDETKKIAQKLGALVILQEFLGDGPQRSFGLGYCKNKWVLNLDADERLDDALIREIKILDLDNSQFDSYEFKRKSIFHNKWIKGSGWYPNYVRRLFNKTKVGFLSLRTHTKIQSNNFQRLLKGHIIHYSYKNYAEMVHIMNRYSSWQAEEMHAFNRNSGVLRAFYHGIFSFIKHYLLKRGFLDGLDGFNISLFKGIGSYLKYIKLHELNQNKKNSFKKP